MLAARNAMDEDMDCMASCMAELIQGTGNS